jgi:hypothetical protein
MGREVRSVAKDWEHPRRVNGIFEPLFEGCELQGAQDEWDVEQSEFNESEEGCTFIEYYGERPCSDDYMPNWSDDEKTHIMMYEDTSEGTPISPAFETPEELARWLTDNNASSFAGMGATYDQWFNMINRGSAVSMVIQNGELKSGVESISEHTGN